jgi:hypothetical protein
MNVWDVLNTLAKDKTVSKKEFDEAGVTIYLLYNQLASNAVTVNLAEFLNQHWGIEAYDAYLFVKPFCKGVYLSWIKGKTKDEIKQDEAKLVQIQKWYNCSMEVAKEYITLLSKEQLKDIIDFYTPKQIKPKTKKKK